MKRALPLLLLLWLAACAKIERIHSGGQALDAGSVLEIQRARVLAGLHMLASGSGLENLCNPEFCGDGLFACSELDTMTAAQKAALVSELSAPGHLAQLESTLEHAPFAVTDDPEEVRWQGVVQDALTKNGVSTWLRSRLSGKSEDDVALQCTHEIHHDLGWSDQGTVAVYGTNFDGRDHIDRTAACVVAAVNGINHKHRTVARPDTSHAPIVLYDFTDPTTTWQMVGAAPNMCITNPTPYATGPKTILHSVNGLGVNDNGYFDGTVFPVCEADVIVRAIVATDGTLILSARGYRVSGLMQSDQLVIYADATTVSFTLRNHLGDVQQGAVSRPAGGDGSFEVTLEAAGGTIRGTIGGTPVAEISTNTAGVKGFVGLQGSAKLRSIRVERDSD